MAETLTTLRALVGRLIGDSTNARWPQATVDGYLNQGLREFARMTKVYQRQASSNLSASATTPTYAFYTMPSDFDEIERVQDTTYGLWLERMELQDPGLSPTWQLDTGNPFRYLYGPFGTELRVWPYPTAAAATLKLFYKAQVPELTSGSDVPAIPVDYQRALAYYAAWACLVEDIQQGDPKRAQIFRAEFDKAMADCQARQSRNFDNARIQVPMRWL